MVVGKEQGVLPSWTIEEAGVRIRDVVRDAHRAGPQRIVGSGEEAVVVVSLAEYARFAAESSSRTPPPAHPRTVYDLFATGPFAQLAGFDAAVPWERVPWGEPERF